MHNALLIVSYNISFYISSMIIYTYDALTMWALKCSPT